jgi:hypothetical protein
MGKVELSGIDIVEVSVLVLDVVLVVDVAGGTGHILTIFLNFKSTNVFFFKLCLV